MAVLAACNGMPVYVDRADPTRVQREVTQSVRAGVQAHSIIAVDGDGPREDASDGVVPAAAPAGRRERLVRPVRAHAELLAGGGFELELGVRAARPLEHELVSAGGELMLRARLDRDGVAAVEANAHALVDLEAQVRGRVGGSVDPAKAARARSASALGVTPET